MKNLKDLKEIFDRENPDDDNGENWYKCDAKLCNNFNNFNSSIFSTNKFIVVGNNGLIIHTEDLKKWKSSPKVTKYDLYSIVKR